MNTTSRSLKVEEICHYCSFLMVLIVLNYRILNSWFIIDDTANIFCSSFDTLRLLFDRYTYIYFNQMFFTPLLPISFKINWLLFKMNPLGYHLFNLLIAFLCCLMFYKIMRLSLPPFFSWLGTVFLAYSLPMSFDIGWITREQYLWGFCLALLSLYLLKKWESSRKKYLLFISITGALLSFLNKEAYTFLPAAVFFISSGSVRQRVAKTIPYFIVLFIYIIWRIYMLGSLGGYPGSTDRSLLYFLQRLFQIPMDLSENLYGFTFLHFCCLAMMAFLNPRMLVFVAGLFIVVISPFIFYPEGGFLLANKALSFVAVVSFSLSYILSKLFSRRKKHIFILFLFLLVPILYGSTTKIMNGQKVIMKLSEHYERASSEIVGSGDQKILVIGNFSHYFSNLEDIYRIMLKKEFPCIRSLSSQVVLPFLDIHDFDKVIILKNLDLNPETVSASSVEVFTGGKASRFIAENLKIQNNLPPPNVKFIPGPDHVKVEIADNREGTFLRCVYMGSYIGCYPIPHKYALKYNRVKKIDKLDIIFISDKGEISQPVVFNP